MELQWDIFRAFFALQLTNHMPSIRRFVAGMVRPKNPLRITYPNAALHLEYNPQKWLGIYLHGAYFHDTYKQNPGTPVPPGWTAHLGFRWSLASNIQPVSFLSRRRKDPQALFTPYTLPQEKRRGLTIRAEGSVRSQQDESEQIHTGQAYALYLTGKISHLTLGAQFVWKSSLWHRQERTTYNNYELDAPLNVQPIWYIALDAAFRHHKTLQFALRISRFQPSFVTSTTQPPITNLPQVWYGPSFRYVALSDEHFALYTLHLQIRWSPTNAVTLALETWFTWNENNRFGFRDQITGRVFSVPKETPQIGTEVLLQVSFWRPKRLFHIQRRAKSFGYTSKRLSYSPQIIQRYFKALVV